MQDVANIGFGERIEHYNLVNPVQEFGPNGSFEHVQNLAAAFVQHLPTGGDGLHIHTIHLRQTLHVALDDVGPGVGGHDEDGVLEIDGAAFIVGEPAVVQHLQKHVEHVRVGFFNLVEKHHRVGFAAHGLGELAALVVAYVSRRRAH